MSMLPQKSLSSALICSKTDIHIGVWWAGAVKWSKRKMLWTKRQSWLSSHITSQNPFTTRLQEGQCQHNVQMQQCTSSHLCANYLNTVVTQRLTFASSFLQLPPLLVNKPQMFSDIPQTPKRQLQLDNQPKSNPPKYLHSSSEHQLCWPFLNFYNYSQVFCIPNGNRPFPMAHAPP